MSAPASLDEAMTTLATAIEETLSLLDPPTEPPVSAPPPEPPPDPRSAAGDPHGLGHGVPTLHLDPGINDDALAHALRHALGHTAHASTRASGNG